MYGIFHIRSVSIGLDSQIWYLFICITGYLNVRKISETMDFQTFVGPLFSWLGNWQNQIFCMCFLRYLFWSHYLTPTVYHESIRLILKLFPFDAPMQCLSVFGSLLVEYFSMELFTSNIKETFASGGLEMYAIPIFGLIVPRQWQLKRRRSEMQESDQVEIMW